MRGQAVYAIDSRPVAATWRDFSGALTAWTPLFVPAAGVVMEPEACCHGAIVAQNVAPGGFGIEVTSLIQTGDLIELDGRRGSVIICS